MRSAQGRLLAVLAAVVLLALDARAVKNPKPAEGEGEFNENVCEAVECVALDAPNGPGLKDAGKVIVSNTANIKACEPSHGRTGDDVAPANAYALPGGGPVVVNADKMKDQPFLFLKATLLEEFTHEAQQGELPAGYNPGLFRRLTLAEAQAEYNEVRAKIKVLQWLEEVGPELVGETDPTITQEDLDRAIAKWSKQLDSHARKLLEKLESLAQQDQIAGDGTPEAEKKARDIWEKCLAAAAALLGWE